MPSIEFKGKSFVQNHHLAVPYHELVPQPKQGLSKTPSLDDNLIIHGDNLLALKALLPTYAGKVKCIYIDPPYNTGNEGWVYNDNVSSPVIREWIGKVVGGDDEDLCRHDKWLCMMTPRLKLLRELLADDGALFVSCDDNEFAALRMLMDDVFGAHGFVATVIWNMMDSPKNTARHFSDDHEYIIVFTRDRDNWVPNALERTESMIARYKNPDNDPRGAWLLGDLAARNFYAEGRYPITTPSGKTIEGPPAGSYWRVSKERFTELDRDGRIWWGTSGGNRPGIKRFLSEVKEGVVSRTIWSWQEVGSTRHSKQELSSILDLGASSDLFITPKPASLLRRILEIASDKDSIILDSFAGSGTTAQAVLELNKQDGGNRRFILVEMEDYADKITAERVRRVIKGVPKAKDESLRAGLGGTFSYFELGDPVEAESLLSGERMPGYNSLARYLFYTATGERFDESKLDEKNEFVGASSEYDVYMLYRPDVEYLKATALTWDRAKELSKQAKGRRVLVFAPAKYIEQSDLNELKITFCQLPFEIYKVTPGGAA